MAKRATAITGACGEHYVAAYLSGFGLIVAMPRAGIPGCDLLVASESAGRAVRVQVKTGTQAMTNSKKEGKFYSWATSYSVIEKDDPNLWYAYVWLNDWPHRETVPELFFVPPWRVVAHMIERREEKAKWPYFWMSADEAMTYAGTSGLQMVRDALSPIDVSKA